MPRKPALVTNQFPYHVTARVNNREAFPLDLSEAWKVLTNEFYLQQTLYRLRVHAFVMMPNHFHLIATAEMAPLSLVMRNFMSVTTKQINSLTGRTGHVYGGRYHWSVIRDPLYYGHALKYVYRNPVKAQICERVESYPFSTISGLFGQASIPLKIEQPLLEMDQLVPENHSDLLEWLNHPHKKEEALAIQRALRRREFKLPVNPKTRKVASLSEINAP